MTPKSRYFLVGAAAVLLIGLGGGLIAFFAYRRAPGLTAAGLPAELRYVPADSEVVAYANVQTVMNSELRRGLESIATDPNTSKDSGAGAPGSRDRGAGAPGSRDDGRVQIDDFAGINVEKQVNHVVAYLESVSAGASGANGAPPLDQSSGRPEQRRGTQSGGADQGAQKPPRTLVLVQGTFEQPRIEQFIRERGGTIEDYNGKRIASHRHSAPPPPTGPPASAQSATAGKEMAVGFVQPGLIALGQADLVRRALDAPSAGGRNVSENADLMKLINEASGSTAWVVGRFDAVSRRMGMPAMLTGQVPPVRLVSAKAIINGGMKAIIRAETADQAAADQVRDVVRGFISLIRLQAGAKPELQETLKSIELSGSSNAVQLSFAMTPDTFKLIQPLRRQRRDRQSREPESAPQLGPQQR